MDWFVLVVLSWNIWNRDYVHNIVIDSYYEIYDNCYEGIKKNMNMLIWFGHKICPYIEILC